MNIKEISIKNNKKIFSPYFVQDSLDFANQIIDENFIEKVNIHYYWRVPKEFSYKQQTAIMSAIVNHDLNKVKINLWSNVDLSSNIYFKKIEKYVENKIWNPIEESKNTPLENSKIFNGPLDDDLCWLGSDLFRLVCLYKYGGIYSDMDVLFLRSILPLLKVEFAYQWGSPYCYYDGEDIEINNAIIHLKQKSKLAFDLLYNLEKMPIVPNGNMWGRGLFKYVKNVNKDLIVFPCAWFNTEWVVDNLNPFKKVDDIDLYDGAFTWHWHNRWDEPIEKGSKFDILDTIIRDKFSNLK